MTTNHTPAAPDRTTSTAPQAGRFRADFPPGTVVFLVGMRINQFWNMRKWGPVIWAMGPMLRELSQHPDLGLLGYRTWVSGRNIMVLQYWSDMDHLMRYATARDAAHLPAWRRYIHAVGYQNPSVGIWHEGYAVDPQTSHLLYGNMPPFGMAQATTMHSARAMGAQPVHRRDDPDRPATDA